MDQNKKAFADYETGIAHDTSLEDYIIFIILSGVPTAIFGKYSFITTILILPTAIFLIIWAITLILNNNRRQFFLCTGLVSIYESIIFMIAAYKVASTVAIIHPMMLLMAIVIYFVALAFGHILYAISIKKGYFVTHKTGSGLAVVGYAGGLGGFMSRYASRFFKVSSDQAVFVITYILIFMGCVFSIGSINIVKYYYIRQLERENSLSDSVPGTHIHTHAHLKK